MPAAGSQRTFFDRQSLRAGDDWEGRIQDGLRRSKHFVVLWSPHAKDSDWVQREVHDFYNHAQPLANEHRRQIFLNMQKRNAAFARLQHVNLPSLQTAYAGGSPGIEEVWERPAYGQAACAATPCSCSRSIASKHSPWSCRY